MDYKMKLDEWLAKNEEARIEYLRRAKELRSIWETASEDAYKSGSVVTKLIDDYSAVKGMYKKECKVKVLSINGVEYLSSRYSQANDYDKFFRDNDCKPLNKGDAMLVLFYSMNEIISRLKKDTASQRAEIIARTQKILEGEPIDVQDYDWTLVLTAANGKKASMWAVEAGGYNIQCRHIRVLVKEVK